MSHTPTPWFYQKDADVYTHIIRPESAKGRIIVHLSQGNIDQSKADALHIVKCVNAHDDLVAAATAFLKYFGSDDPETNVGAMVEDYSTLLEVQEKCRAALVKAGAA